MRKKRICAIGIGCLISMAVPGAAVFADAPLPSMEAPGGEGSAPAEESSSSSAEGTEAPSEREEPAGPGEGAAAAGGTTIIRDSQSRTDYSEIGPGIGLDKNAESQNQENAGTDFTTLTVSDPVIKPAEKYSYEQMKTDIEALKNRYGTAHMTVNTIGTSADGREIYDIIIGNANAGKHVLIQGAMHAREYMNPLLMMKQIEDALAFYDTGSYNGRNLSDLLNQVAVHFVPMSNPDGVALSQFGLDAIQSADLRDRIQNCYASDTAAGRTSLDFDTYLTRWKANARGVDLNYNFDALWNNASSTWLLPSSSGYKGIGPASEPEAQALVNLINNGCTWVAVLNYHSMGNVIYWDIEGNQVKAKSQHLAQLMSAATGGYQMLYSGGGGGFKDWLQLKDNPVPSITIETGKVDCPMPLSEFENVWAQNRAGWALAADFALLY